MTDRTSGEHRTKVRMQDTVRWVSTAEEDVPAYGVIQLRANFASNFSQAAKPNSSSGLFYANGGTPVATSKYGESQVWSRPQLVLIDGSPTVGDEVGPVDGEWFMSAEGTGYRVIHQAVDGVGSVVQAGGGGGAVVTSVRFEIISSDPTTLTALGNILSWDYGFEKSQIPASILDHTVIELCDPRGCILNEPNVDLTGRQGTAVYRQGEPDAVCRNGYPPFAGVWEAETLCCKLISCEVII